MGRPPCERIHSANCSSLMPAVALCKGNEPLEAFCPAVVVAVIIYFELAQSVFEGRVEIKVVKPDFFNLLAYTLELVEMARQRMKDEG